MYNLQGTWHAQSAFCQPCGRPRVGRPPSLSRSRGIGPETSQAPDGAASEQALPDCGQYTPFGVILAANKRLFFPQNASCQRNLLTPSARALWNWRVQVAHLSAPPPMTSLCPSSHSTTAADSRHRTGRDAVQGKRKGRFSMWPWPGREGHFSRTSFCKRSLLRLTAVFGQMPVPEMVANEVKTASAAGAGWPPTHVVQGGGVRAARSRKAASCGPAAGASPLP